MPLDEGLVRVRVGLSLKSMESVFGLLLEVAVPEVNAAALNVREMFETSLAFAWAAALPVNDKVNTVALVLVTTSVKPLGTFVTVYSVFAVKTPPVPAVHVSPEMVTVLVSVMEPSLAVASVKVVPE